MNASVLTCHGLVLDYGTTRALAGIGLTFSRGESVAIMGPSGSGKTTLLHCLAGILRPTAGSVILDGGHGPLRLESQDDEQLAAVRRTEFGFVFQSGLLLPELTALENVALPLLLTGAARPQAEQHALAWLDRLGLTGLGGRRIGQLSGGQAQRVAIARAQAGSPRVVFADEPTGALDQATGAEVLSALLGSTLATGGTLVVVTHDEQVAARCSRVIRLRDGRVVADSRGHGAAGVLAATVGTPGIGVAG